MSQVRGRRTRHVAVYLSEAEAAAWDILRDIQRGSGWAGTYPPGRGAWVVDRLIRELDRIAQDPYASGAPRAERALQTIEEEARRLGPPDLERAHGRVQRRARP